MEERYYIQVGNCFVQFLGLWHEAKMRPDYRKASPYLTSESAKLEAKKRGIKNFKVVKRCFEMHDSYK